MMSQQEISDRLEIQDLMLRYTHAVDTRDWDAFRRVFTDDAFVDYTAFGGVAGTVSDVVGFLEAVMPMFSAFQHHVTPPMIDFAPAATDDAPPSRATARTMCHNPMVFPQSDGTPHVFVCGLWYADELRRTDAGWRISRRVEERGYVDRFPTELGG